MPIIIFRTNNMASQQIKSDLAEGLSYATEKILRKKKENIVVRFDIDHQQHQWYVDGVSKNDKEIIVELSITITKGTNTDSEKAEWIVATWRLITEALGSLPGPNYISIMEIDAKSWGYNGLTQSQR